MRGISTRNELRLVDPAEGSVWLQEPGREGIFVWHSVDNGPLDPNEGIYIRANKGVWVRSYHGSARVSWFGDLFEGLSAAWAITKNLILTPGVEYEFAETLTAINENVDLTCTGAILKQMVSGDDNQKKDIAMFSISGSYDLETNVIAVEGDHILLNSPIPVTSGDVLKIVSDDPLQTARGFNGEFLVVHRVDGPKLFVVSMPKYKYSTNIRIARLSNSKVTLRDLDVDHSDRTFNNNAVDSSLPIQRIKVPILIKSLKYPTIISPKFRWGYTSMIEMQDCFGGNVRDMIVEGGKDNDELDKPSTRKNPSQGNGYFSYGITLMRSTACRIVGGNFSRLRHAVVCTGLSYDPEPNMDISKYGEAFGNTISNCVAYDCFGASYDTHHGSTQNVYENCHSYGSRAAAFNIRGQDNVINNCTSHGDRNGVFSFVEAARSRDSTTSRTLVNNLTVINCKESAYIANHGEALVVNGGITVSDRIDHSTPLFVQYESGDLKISNHRIDLKRAKMTNLFVINTDRSVRLHLENLTLDCEDVKMFHVVGNFNKELNLFLNNFSIHGDYQLNALTAGPLHADSIITNVHGKI